LGGIHTEHLATGWDWVFALAQDCTLGTHKALVDNRLPAPRRNDSRSDKP
jgi:hypothetical protein